jgi:hypothetical protein
VEHQEPGLRLFTHVQHHALPVETRAGDSAAGLCRLTYTDQPDEPRYPDLPPSVRDGPRRGPSQPVTALPAAESGRAEERMRARRADDGTGSVKEGS